MGFIKSCLNIEEATINIIKFTVETGCKCKHVLVLQAVETIAQTVIFEKSGTSVGNPSIYTSQSNSVTITFTTDISTNFDGWRIEWREIVPTTTSTTSTSTTTTPPGNKLE